jgi:putative tryptophan/tyrosine transport system substrate-binding protein
MRRRDLLLLAAVALWPNAAGAQRKVTPVIGMLGLGRPEDRAIALNLEAFRAGLNDTGFVEGRNVTIEYRWAHDDERRLPALAVELVDRNVDVLVTEGGIRSALAAKHATSTIPIVFHASDAIADGVVGNLARPEANLTGVSLFAPESLAKQFQLLADLVPEVKVIALLAIPNTVALGQATAEIREAASTRGVQYRILDVVADSDMDAALTMLGGLHAGAIVRANGNFADRLVMLAARHRVPAIYNQRAFAAAGGLLSYGVSLPAVYLIKGRYAGKILRGAKPADLPVQQPTKFELVLNLKTAKALGLTVPPSLLARADEVIE